MGQRVVFRGVGVREVVVNRGTRASVWAISQVVELVRPWRASAHIY